MKWPSFLWYGQPQAERDHLENGNYGKNVPTKY